MKFKVAGFEVSLQWIENLKSDVACIKDVNYLFGNGLYQWPVVCLQIAPLTV